MLQFSTPIVWSVTRDFWAKPTILVTTAKQTLVYSVFYRNAEGGENACALFWWKSISSTYLVCSSVSHTLWDCHSVGVSFRLVARLLMWVRGQHGKIKKFFRFLFSLDLYMLCKIQKKLFLGDKYLFHHFGGMLAWKSGLSFFIRALKNPFSGTWKWASHITYNKMG